VYLHDMYKMKVEGRGTVLSIVPTINLL